MLKLFLSLLTLLVLSSCAWEPIRHETQPYKWTQIDNLLESTFTALNTADMAQMEYISKHPDKFSTKNPLLGKHPTNARIQEYFAIESTLHFGIAYLLPQPYRKYWQYIFIGSEVGVIGNRMRLGVGFAF